MEYVINGVIGVLCSIVAAWIFWYFSFKRSNVNIKFADQIEKSPNAFGDRGYRYRIKLINIGSEDLIEVSFFVKLFIKRRRVKNSCYLRFGYREFTPILYGRKWQNKKQNKKTGFSWTIELGMAEETFLEFSKKFYPKEIRAAAMKGTLTLDDILNTFRGDAEIAVYAFGYDSVTGARKMFTSKRYTVKDVLEGSYRRSTPMKKYEDYIDNMLSIDVLKPAPPSAPEADAGENELC